MLECESSTDVEIIIGTYEEFVLGYKVLKNEDGTLNLTQSFANHSHRASVRCVAGGGRFMASGGADDMIQLYDMKLRKEMGVLMHHDKTVTCLVFIGKSHLASCSDDGELALWRSGSWQCEKVFNAHPDSGVLAIAVHPSGKMCLTAGKDQKLRTWSLVKGRAAYTTNLHGIAEELRWSPNGNYYGVLKLVKGGAQFSVDVYSTSAAAVVYSVVTEQRPSSFIFLQDDLVAVGTITGSIELHSISKKAQVCEWNAHSGRIRCVQGVAFASGDIWLVSASNNGDIIIWKFKKTDLLGKIGPPKQLGMAAANCRITCLSIVSVPEGAVPHVKNEVEIPVDDVKPLSSSKSRPKVIIELEEGSEEEQELRVNTKKVKKVKKSKTNKEVKNKIKSGMIKKKQKLKKKSNKT